LSNTIDNIHHYSTIDIASASVISIQQYFVLHLQFGNIREVLLMKRPLPQHEQSVIYVFILYHITLLHILLKKLILFE